MNDIRRTILWVIFGFSMVLLWDKWQIHNGNKATFFPAPEVQTAAAPATPGASSPAAGGGANSVPSATTASAPAAAAGVQQVPGGVAPAPRHERVTVDTDVLRLTFDSDGGSLIQGDLLKYPEMADKSKPFVLLDESGNRVYVAQTGLIGGNFPNHKTPMTVVPGPRSLADGQNELSVRFESPDLGGVKLVKTWTVQRGAYVIAVKHEVVNTGTAPVSPQLYLQLVRDGNKPPESRLSTPPSPARPSIPRPRSTTRSSSRTSKAARPRSTVPPTTATWPWCSTTSPRPGCWPTASSATCSCARWTPTCTRWA